MCTTPSLSQLMSSMNQRGKYKIWFPSQVICNKIDSKRGKIILLSQAIFSSQSSLVSANPVLFVTGLSNYLTHFEVIGQSRAIPRPSLFHPTIPGHWLHTRQQQFTRAVCTEFKLCVYASKQSCGHMQQSAQGAARMPKGQHCRLHQTLTECKLREHVSLDY